MTSDKQIEREFGLGMTMDEALQRFGQATKDELALTGATAAQRIPDGELELVPFKKEAIRRVCHNDEWWYSIVDVVSALTGSTGVGSTGPTSERR